MNQSQTTLFRAFYRLALLLAVFLVLAPAGNLQAKEAPSHSWATELEALSEWLIETKDLVPRPKETPPAPECEENCFVLDTLTLGGSVDANKLRFTLTGAVLAKTKQRVPLFGPPEQVALSQVRINKQPAIIGFHESNAFYVLTDASNFVIEGDLALLDSLSLNLPGPLNQLVARFTAGRLVEGERLSGLRQETVHLEPGTSPQSNDTESETSDDRPPIFSVSRAIRIQKETSFEYKVHVRSGQDINSVRLPLPFGETVLDVPNHKGWTQENDTLMVPTSGRDIEFTVYGRLPKVTTFQPDERSAYEWWMIESDPEYRVMVDTRAKQVDSSESPLSRKLSSSRLFFVTKGQSLNATVQPLTAKEALAAVVNQHRRTIVWTRDGDLVAEDVLNYENNGIDYLTLNAEGKPIYLEVDYEAQKILSDDKSKMEEVLIPMKKGSHAVRVQSLTTQARSWLGGTLSVPFATHGLTTSRASLTLGLPGDIVPLWITGGQGIKSPVGLADVIFVLLALAFAVVLFHTNKDRAVGFIALAGLYFYEPTAFVLLLAGSFVLALVVLVWRKLQGWKRWFVFGSIALIVMPVLISMLSVVSDVVQVPGASAPHEEMMSKELSRGSASIKYDKAAKKVRAKPMMEKEESRYAQRRLDNELAQVQDGLGNAFFGGLAEVQGVTPVALPLPGYERSLYVKRELVTTQRPLKPTLIYTTQSATLPLLILWLISLVLTGKRLLPGARRMVEAIVSFWKAPETESSPDAQAGAANKNDP